MKRRILISSLEEGEFYIEHDSSLVAVPFTPLEERLTAENNGLREGMGRLKAGMEEGDFDRHINSLISIKKYNDQLHLITQNPRSKSIIEFKFSKLLADSFGVSSIRVFSQPF